MFLLQFEGGILSPVILPFIVLFALLYLLWRSKSGRLPLPGLGDMPEKQDLRLYPLSTAAEVRRIGSYKAIGAFLGVATRNETHHLIFCFESRGKVVLASMPISKGLLLGLLPTSRPDIVTSRREISIRDKAKFHALLWLTSEDAQQFLHMRKHLALGMLMHSPPRDNTTIALIINFLHLKESGLGRFSFSLKNANINNRNHIVKN
ncbi:MAG TPA: hypothetical protein VEA59_01860, partial [Patescibacteria group bacterium]|nr:hypothetical protein [Patescibacteria group bacterium]